MHIYTNPTSTFRYERALLQRIVDPLNAVSLHCQQETTEDRTIPDKGYMVKSAMGATEAWLH